MQFQVPQFIEVEDKIFGPLTFKQFIYILGGAGACYVLYRILPIFIAAPVIVCVAGLSAALAFFEYNGRPFILALENGFYFVTRTKLYLWNNSRRERKRDTSAQAAKASRAEIYVPKLSDSKLHELAWSLDIKERIAAGINPDETELPRERPDVLSPILTARSALIR